MNPNRRGRAFYDVGGKTRDAEDAFQINLVLTHFGERGVVARLDVLQEFLNSPVFLQLGVRAAVLDATYV